MGLHRVASKRLLFLIHLLVAGSWLAGSTVVSGAEPLRPTRVTTAPVLDGVLDDEIWRAARQVTGFKTWRPDYGIESPDQTIVYSAYDAENMYFGFRVFDAEPSKIKASMASRDSIRPDDWICINLDSFNDQQAMYGFYVNPLGIQMDSRYAAGRDDVGFDMVWYSAGRIDDKGYVLEIRIPFKSIHYAGRNPVTMGVVFERFVSRRSEGSTYPPLDPRSGSNFSIQAMPLTFEDIKHYRLLEVLPDVTYNRQDEARAGSLTRASSGGDFGVTAKYGVTAQLTVDGTYNPDFSQVEADAGQVDINLRAPLFFAEKRPFFLEGSEVFNMAGPAQHGVLQAAVHTRTIVNPLAGVKLSGKLGPSDTVAALYAIDDAPVAIAGTPEHAQVSVLRYKRSLQQDSYLGGFYVGREQGELSNRVGGMDGSIRLGRASSLGFHAFESDTSARDAAPGARGHAVGADFTRETRRWTLYLSGLDVSKDFQAETGYLTRTGLGQLLSAGYYRFYPKSRVWRRVQVGAVTQHTRDAESGLWEAYNEANTQLLLARATTFNLYCSSSTEVFRGQEFGTSGCNTNVSMQLHKRLRLQATGARRNAIYYAALPFGGRSTRGSLSLVYQPREQWSTALDVTYANFDRASTGTRLYDYTIVRNKTTFQLNRYLFFRGIAEYNSYHRQLVTDFLASFTYIPGTVVHVGYGSLYEKRRWDGWEYVRDGSLHEMRRGLFLKASYLWRL